MSDQDDLNRPRRILIMMSDTGGGHRAVAEAIRDALVRKHGDEVDVRIVDVFRSYTPFPYKYFPEMYPWAIKNGKLAWRLSYSMSNRRGRVRLINSSIGRGIQRGIRRMLLDEHDVDVIVCVHPLFATPTMNVLRLFPDRPPFMSVVTDLVSTHAFWYERRLDRILVPTQPAYDHGISLGVAPEKLRVTGLPVNPRFADGLMSKDAARERLGWDATLPTILLVGGGQGMGPLFRIARRINRLEGQFQFAIVAGRNKLLKERLDTQEWKHPTRIYGFVTNMPEMMAAADLLITKAGAATISEACMAALPMILSDKIPGQEDGNVSYIVSNRAGVYAPGPARTARAVNDWLEHGAEFLKERAENAHKLARPDAVWEVADEVWHYAHQPRINQPSTRRSKRTPRRGRAGVSTKRRIRHYSD